MENKFKQKLLKLFSNNKFLVVTMLLGALVGLFSGKLIFSNHFNTFITCIGITFTSMYSSLLSGVVLTTIVDKLSKEKEEVEVIKKEDIKVSISKEEDIVKGDPKNKKVLKYLNLAKELDLIHLDLYKEWEEYLSNMLTNEEDEQIVKEICLYLNILNNLEVEQFINLFGNNPYLDIIMYFSKKGYGLQNALNNNLKLAKIK